MGIFFVFFITKTIALEAWTTIDRGKKVKNIYFRQ